MPSFTLKNIPQKTLSLLRIRAQEHHRSLQGEMMHLIDESLNSPRGKISIEELHERIKRLGVRDPSESVRMIREDRDAR